MCVPSVLRVAWSSQAPTPVLSQNRETLVGDGFEAKPPNPPGHSTASSAILGFEAQTEKPAALVVLRPKLPNPPGHPAAPGATPGFEDQTRKPSLAVRPHRTPLQVLRSKPGNPPGCPAALGPRSSFEARKTVLLGDFPGQITKPWTPRDLHAGPGVDACPASRQESLLDSADAIYTTPMSTHVQPHAESPSPTWPMPSSSTPTFSCSDRAPCGPPVTPPGLFGSLGPSLLDFTLHRALVLRHELFA